jgi:hypothetical protein
MMCSVLALSIGNNQGMVASALARSSSQSWVCSQSLFGKACQAFMHVRTISFIEMEGEASDKNIAFMLQEDKADGPYYHQEWQGMQQTKPISSGGLCLAIASVLQEIKPLQHHFDSRR